MFIIVVLDGDRCVYESQDFEDFKTALCKYKDECRLSALRIIMYEKMHDKWVVVRERSQFVFNG